MRVLVARFSALYGAGQATQKNQGLLTHIARSAIRSRPIRIYVAFDTIRYYIIASDAAAARMVMILRHGAGLARYEMQLVASERPPTIAEIVATFERVPRHTPRVVTSFSPSIAFYTRRVPFRSLFPAATDPFPNISLTAAIGQLMQAERCHFAQPVRR